MSPSTDTRRLGLAANVAVGATGMLLFTGNAIAGLSQNISFGDSALAVSQLEVEYFDRSTTWAITSSATEPSARTRLLKDDVPARHWLVGTGAAELALAAVREEIEAYEGLSDGWDGPSSKAPSKDSVELAKDMLEQLPQALPIPKSMLSPSGEIGLYWNLSHRFADIVLEESGTLSVFIRAKDNERKNSSTD